MDNGQTGNADVSGTCMAGNIGIAMENVGLSLMASLIA